MGINAFINLAKTNPFVIPVTIVILLLIIACCWRWCNKHKNESAEDSVVIAVYSALLGLFFM